MILSGIAAHLAAAVVLSVTFLPTAPAAAQAPPPSNRPGGPGRGGPQVNSPEVSPERKVTFRIQAPKASDVTVRGDWMTGPAEKLAKDDNGVWSVTLGPLTPDYYSYAFNVDGVK